MLTVRDLPQAVLGFVTDPGHLSQLITSYFEELLVDLREVSKDGVPAHPELDLGSIDVDTTQLDDYQWPHTQIQDVAISHLNQIVSVYDVSVDGAPGDTGNQPTSGTAEATVELLADLEVWTYEIDRDGEVQMDAHTLYDARIIAPLLVQIENGVARYIAPLGETRACPGRVTDP